VTDEIDTKAILATNLTDDDGKKKVVNHYNALDRSSYKALPP
jgi:hypothetical protein